MVGRQGEESALPVSRKRGRGSELRSFFMYPKWRSTHLDLRQGCSGTGETWFPFEHVWRETRHVCTDTYIVARRGRCAVVRGRAPQPPAPPSARRRRAGASFAKESLPRHGKRGRGEGAFKLGTAFLASAPRQWRHRRARRGCRSCPCRRRCSRPCCARHSGRPRASRGRGFPARPRPSTTPS